MSELFIDRLNREYLDAIRADLWDVSADELRVFDLSPELLIGMLAMPVEFSACILCHGRPVCAWAAHELKDEPGTYQTYFIASSLFPQHGRAATDMIRGALREGVRRYHPKRVISRSAATHPKALAWFRGLGYRRGETVAGPKGPVTTFIMEA